MGLAAPAPAQTSNEVESEPASPVPALEVRTESLPNGVRVLLNVDSRSPTVAFCAFYAVGHRHDPERARGLAELTARVLAQRSIEPRLASEPQVTVTGDSTRFCHVVPRGELERVLWVEARRQNRLALTPKSLRPLLDELRQHHEQRSLSEPQSLGVPRLQALVFQRHPYGSEGLVSATRLEASVAKQVVEFHKKHFGAHRLLLTISGDFEPKVAMSAARERFGSWHKRKASIDSPPTDLPVQKSERFSAIQEPTSRFGSLHIGWAIPAPGSAEHAALRMAALVLARGESSRLHQGLIRKKGLAQHVASWSMGHQGPDLLALRIDLSKGTTPLTVEKEVRAALLQLRSVGPTAKELQRVREQLKAALLFRLDSNLGRVEYLAERALRGQGTDPLEHLAAYDKVSPVDVRRTVGKYLLTHRSTVVEVHPPGLPAAPLPPMKKFHLVRKGDTLIGIAKRHGVAVTELRRINGLTRGKAIFPGQKLELPKGAKQPQRDKVKADQPSEGATKRGQRAEKGSKTKQSREASKGSKSDEKSQKDGSEKKHTQVHVVRAGESLARIARRYGVSLEALVRANGLNAKRPIRPGQKLRIVK